MNRKTPFSRVSLACASVPVTQSRLVLICLLYGLLGLVLISTSAYAADDYLSALDQEVQKVEARKIDGEAGVNEVESAAQVEPSDPGVVRSQASREAFEALLKRKYVGTFGFYKKIPERSRQEIFQEYRGGTPMADIRRKIIDRLLQR